MILKKQNRESGNKVNVSLSEKMRVLKSNNNNNLKVRVSIRDLNLIKRELIRKALAFSERVRI